MEALKERVKREGQNLGRGILKVDGFINHQVDPELMVMVGRELAGRFGGAGARRRTDVAGGDDVRLGGRRRPSLGLG